MKKTILALSMAGATMLMSSHANAEVLNFEDAPTSDYVALTSYKGYTFGNVYNVAGQSYGYGYAAGVVSAPNVIFNGYGNIASISSATAFLLNSAYFTGAYGDQSVTVTGYNGLTQVFSETFDTLISSPTLHSFNAVPITSFSFVSPNSQVVIDNLNLSPATAAVPEPATWALMILGMGAVGFAMRRRKTVNMTVRFA
ncbi:PEPxxWA-CTERM sorting domain-containing protein [Sphingomonas sp. MA1305]|uniref:PEPxxWA-CTERM sorting domain-containing protein n=1 Tax=Sphingomonas sp. MA1305 TaxID=2479204 RepID=UPI001E524550|nr:PEPxxWA-CTERM sorting domain-containing protein [Sphingomonas sp. MA1305]